MAASNTFDCFRECLGLRVVAVLKNSLPLGRRDLASGTKTLVFEDGTGLTVASNGSYWREIPANIQRAIRLRHDELARAQDDMTLLAQADGVLSAMAASEAATRRLERAAVVVDAGTKET